MRMNNDQERRAGKLVGVLLALVAPTFLGVLCAALVCQAKLGVSYGVKVPVGKGLATHP